MQIGNHPAFRPAWFPRNMASWSRRGGPERHASYPHSYGPGDPKRIAPLGLRACSRRSRRAAALLQPIHCRHGSVTAAACAWMRGAPSQTRPHPPGSWRPRWLSCSRALSRINTAASATKPAKTMQHGLRTCMGSSMRAGRGLAHLAGPASCNRQAAWQSGEARVLPAAAQRAARAGQARRERGHAVAGAPR